MPEGTRLHLEVPSLPRMGPFLQAVRRSRSLHRGWVSPPATAEKYRAYLARTRRESFQGYLVCLPDGEIAGVVNISEIVQGLFRSAYLGFYALAPHQGQGHMRAGAALVVSRAFRTHRLHRLEANVQPGNLRSRKLIQRLGFRLEGFSPRYLKIAGQWRDHERWAVTVEDWKRRRGGSNGTLR